MDVARERVGGGSERRREGATERGRGTGMSVGGMEVGREHQGMYPDEDTGQCTVYLAQTTHNAALALETLVFQMKNSEHV